MLRKIVKVEIEGVCLLTSGSVVLIGGGGEDLTDTTLPISFDGDQLFQLKSPEGPWVELQQKLKEKRSQHTSFLVPDELVKCE